MDNKYDLIVVGAGPAGITAAIYAARNNQKVIVIENEELGSMLTSHKIDNYPGFVNGISGKELYNNMKQQAIRFNVTFKNEIFFDLEDFGNYKTVKTEKTRYDGHAVIIATGINKKSQKKYKGEEEFIGRGVSYCAACDGAFFSDAVVSVFGKGNETSEEVLMLSEIARKVYYFINDNKLEVEHEIMEKLENTSKIELVYNAQLDEIFGEQLVKKVVVNVNNVKTEYDVDGIFLYLGTKSNFELYSIFANVDDSGMIITDENMETITKGIYAAGDIRKKSVRQVTTAVSDGTIAAMSAIKYIINLKK